MTLMESVIRPSRTIAQAVGQSNRRTWRLSVPSGSAGPGVSSVAAKQRVLGT